MATTTPNFGWAVPTSTDLVKDGAVAIETLGDAIDASLLDLKGGTTNQVLAKNSNTDMDFKWVSDATGMTNPMTTTGDVIYSSSGSTPARLGLGTAGQVLQVNSGATAPEWATPAGGGGKVLQVVNATYSTGTAINTTTFTDTGLTATITPTSATSKVLVLVTQTFATSRSTSECAIGWRLMRGATSVWAYDAPFAMQMYAAGTTAWQVFGILNMSYLDSPATTSATTYKTQGKVGSTANSGISDWQYGSGATITLLEIGA
jgi:hypothetical protein